MRLPTVLLALSLAACTPAVPPAPGAPPSVSPGAPAVRPPVGAPTVRAVVPLDRAPTAAAAIQGHVALAHADAGGLTVLDPASGQLRPVPLDGAIAGDLQAFPDGQAGLVRDVAGERLLVVDPGAATPIVQAVPLGDQPVALAISPDGASAVVGLGRSGDLLVLDFGAVRSRAPGRKVLARGGGLAAGAAIAYDGARVLAPAPGGQGYRLFQVKDGTSADLPAAAGPIALASYDQGPLKLPLAILPAAAGGGVAIANPAVPGGPKPVAVGGPVTRLGVFGPLFWVYAAVPATRELVAVNYVSREIRGRVVVGKDPGQIWFQKVLPYAGPPLPSAAPSTSSSVGAGKYALTHVYGLGDPDLAYEAWVSNDGDATVSVFDADGAVPGVAHLPAGPGRKHIAFLGDDAYVASEGGKQLTVIQRPSI